MDVFDAMRLAQAREALESQRRDFQAGIAAGHADALRSSLVDALGALKALQDKDEIWETAKSVVGASRAGDFDRLRDHYSDTLPPLLRLFGYRDPPPPTADRLVWESIGLIQEVADGNSAIDAVEEARQALRNLLDRTLVLAAAEPWDVSLRATETNDALEMGISIVAGSLSGAVTGLATGVAAGALTGGLGLIPGALVAMGVRRWHQVRAIRAQTDFLRAEQERLNIELFPAGAAAVRNHLDAVLRPDHGPTSAIKTRVHLQALIDVSARFALAREHLIAPVRQAGMRGNPEPERLFNLFLTTHTFALQAQANFELYGEIGSAEAGRLEDVLHSFSSAALPRSPQVRIGLIRPQSIEP